MAATADFDSARREGIFVSLPMAATAKIYGGTLVAIDAAGNAVPASDTAGLKVIGRADEQVDNTAGAAAALNVKVRSGVFRFANSATGTLTKANVGQIVYVEDDKTVSSAAGNNAIAAGVLVEVDSDGAWVNTGLAAIAI